MGANISGLIAKEFGETGKKSIHTINLEGCAGQSLGVWNAKGLEINLRDQREEEGQSDSFKFKGGLSDFVKYLDEQNNPLHNKVITVTKEGGEIPVDVALRYGNTYNDNINNSE